MKKPIFKQLSCPMYGRRIYFGVGSQAELINKFKRVSGVPDCSLEDVPGRYGMVYTANSGPIFIWIHGYSGSPDDVDTLSHEAFHLTFSVMEQVGVTLSEESEEAFAYALGYYTNQMVRIIKEHK